jgi:hypothetical protein
MTSNGPGREYFGEACIPCDPADEDSIRAALRRALAAPRDPTLAARLRERFTWDAAAEVLFKMYGDVLTQDGAPAPVSTTTMTSLARALCELRALKAENTRALEEQARAQAAWTRELEWIAARQKQRARSRAARWLGKLRGG